MFNLFAFASFGSIIRIISFLNEKSNQIINIYFVHIPHVLMNIRRHRYLLQYLEKSIIQFPFISHLNIKFISWGWRHTMLINAWKTVKSPKGNARTEVTHVVVEIEIVFEPMTSAQCKLLFRQGKGQARKRYRIDLPSRHIMKWQFMYGKM